MPRVTAPPLARLAASVIIAVSTATATACASGPDEAAVPPPPPATTTTTAPPGLPAAEARCDPVLLTAAVQARQPGAALADIVCERPFAVATVTGPGATGGEAALLRAGAEGWAVVDIGPLVEGEPVPAGFSTAMVARWHAQFRPPPPPAPEEPTVGSGESLDGGAPSCVEEPAFAEDGTELPPVVVCEEPPGPVIL